MIRECVREGARSVDDVGDACRAATGCGGCAPLVEQLIQLETSRDGARRQLRDVERPSTRPSEAEHAAA